MKTNKAREVFIPSIDTKLASIHYDTEKKALNYAMRKGVMSCGAPMFREVLPVEIDHKECTLDCDFDCNGKSASESELIELRKDSECLEFMVENNVHCIKMSTGKYRMRNGDGFGYGLMFNSSREAIDAAMKENQKR